MVGPSKILTVSYGTFSCTLEGFDDPFSTMRGIAEYFRDLAADDRYFGAEPPTPDAEMLHRIAEREIEHRVEARVDDNGITLRQLEESDKPQSPAAPVTPTVAAPQIEEPVREEFKDSAAEPETGAEELEDIAEPVAVSPVQDSVAAKLARIRSAVSHQTDDDLQKYTEDQEAEEIYTARPISVAFADLEDEAEIEEVEDEFEDETEAEVFTAEEAVADVAEADETETFVEEEIQTSSEFEDEYETEVEPEEQLEVVSEDIVSVQADTEAQVDEETFAAPLEDAEDDAEPEIAAGEQEDLVAEEEVSFEAASEDDFEEDEEVTVVSDFQTGETEYDDEYESGDFSAVSDETDVVLTDDVGVSTDLETAAEVEYEAEAESEFEAEVEDDAETEAEAEAMDQPDSAAIARVVKMRRSDFETAVEDSEYEEIDEQDSFDEGPAVLVDETDAPSDDAGTQMFDDEDEAESQAQEFETEDQTSQDEVLAQDSEEETEAEFEEEAVLEAEEEENALSEEDEADLMATLELVQRETDAENRADKEGRALLEHQDIEEDGNSVDRILEVTNTELEETEGTRRRSAIAHLKAAVLATRADKILSRERDERGNGSEQNQYRDDLAMVVRPRRPSGPTTPTERRLAPLMLVSEQRVDVAEDSDGATGEREVVRPRRVRSGEDGQESALSGENNTTSGDENIFSDSGSFGEFAEKMGASELPDLLEAAAAYASYIEGKPHFSRPQIMKAVLNFDEDKEFTREEGLRSFGQLLRRGKIQKLKRGQFTISQNTRFNPEARAVGE